MNNQNPTDVSVMELQWLSKSNTTSNFYPILMKFSGEHAFEVLFSFFVVIEKIFINNAGLVHVHYFVKI